MEIPNKMSLENICNSSNNRSQRSDTWRRRLYDKEYQALRTPTDSEAVVPYEPQNSHELRSLYDSRFTRSTPELAINEKPHVDAHNDTQNLNNEFINHYNNNIADNLLNCYYLTEQQMDHLRNTGFDARRYHAILDAFDEKLQASRLAIPTIRSRVIPAFRRVYSIINNGRSAPNRQY